MRVVPLGSGHETGFIEPPSSRKHRRVDDMSRSVVRAMKPARLQLSQEIAAEGGASSNAASKAVFRGPASGNISRYGNAIRYRSVLYARAFSLSLSLPRSLASLSFDLRPDFPYFFVTGFIKIYRHGPRFAWIKRSIRELERDGKEVTGVTVNVPVNYNTKRSTVAIGLSCRRGFVFKRIHV